MDEKRDSMGIEIYFRENARKSVGSTPRPHAQSPRERSSEQHWSIVQAFELHIFLLNAMLSIR
jgi:hypothetical protein